MKKLLLLIAAVSFTAATYAQSAQSTTVAPAKTETKKEGCSKGSGHACCKSASAKSSSADKAQSSDKATVAPAATSTAAPATAAPATPKR